MNGEVQITDIVISKILRQNIEKYRSLFPHVAAAICCLHETQRPFCFASINF